MSIFIIKVIACITMVLDHIKYAVPETRCFATIYLGRIAFPLFAFLAVEGYKHTSNLRKYYKRLIIFALISQIPFMLFRTLVGEWRMLNIIFTLILGLFAITVFDKLDKKYNTLIGDNGIKLSGGQKQRLILSRNLIKKPNILIIDNGFTGLDINTRKIVVENLSNKNKKTTLVIISSMIEDIKNADKIYKLENKTLVEMDEVEVYDA